MKSNFSYYTYTHAYVLENIFFVWWDVRNIHAPWDFPGGAVVKNPPANAGDTGLSPGPGRSHMPRSN